MAAQDTKIVLTAEDRTKAAFDSVVGNFTTLQKSLGGLDGLAGKLPGIGAAAAAAFGAVSFSAVIKGAVDYAGQLHDLSQQTGATVEQLSALRNVAELSGTSLDTAGAGLAKLTRSMTEAASGSEKQAAAFDALGVAIKTSQGNLRESGDVMGDVARAIAAIESPTERVAAAQLVLGKSGAELVPLLMDIATYGLDAAKVTSAQAAASDALGDSLTQMRQQLRDSGESLALTFIPAMAMVADVAQGAMIGIQQFAASLTVVAKDIATYYEIIGAALFSKSPDDRRDNIKQALDDRARFVEAANEDMEQRLGRYQSIYDKVINPELPSAKRKTGGTFADMLAKLNNGSGNGNKPKAEAAPYDYDAELTTRIAKAIEGTDLVKVQALQDELRKLNELAAAGLDPLIVEQIRDDLTGATKRAADEQARLNALLEATPGAQLEKAREDMLRLADALEQGKISIEQFNEAAIARTGLVADKAKEATDYAKELGMTFSSAFEDAVIGGKKFSEVLQGIGEDIARILLRKSVTEPLANAIGSFDWGSLLPSANGNVFPAGPGISAYSSSIVSQPTLFPFANGIGLMGEAGAEAIMPLTRINGKLGVRAEGGGASPVVVNVIEAPGQGGQVNRRQDGNTQIIDVMVEQVESKIAGNIASGRGGMLSGAMERTYGLSRVAGAY